MSKKLMGMHINTRNFSKIDNFLKISLILYQEIYNIITLKIQSTYVFECKKSKVCSTKSKIFTLKFFLNTHDMPAKKSACTRYTNRKQSSKST